MQHALEATEDEEPLESNVSAYIARNPRFAIQPSYQLEGSKTGWAGSDVQHR